MKKDNIIHTFIVLAYEESQYLEDCLKSVTNQKYKSKVAIATSTPNKFIVSLAKKYKLEIIENKKHINIGGDFDFAIQSGDTELVTIAHQDDIYDYEYSYEMVQTYLQHKDSIILFPNYYEIKNNKKEVNNRNLKIKRFLLRPLINKEKSASLFRKRSALRLGCAIGCPSVTFVKSNIKFPVFECHLLCNVDWNAWERLSKLPGKFIYINKYLMGHRIHEESTTTKIIQHNIRTKEDLEILERFWPRPVAKVIGYLYKNSEKNNRIK